MPRKRSLTAWVDYNLQDIQRKEESAADVLGLRICIREGKPYDLPLSVMNAYRQDNERY